MGKKVHKQVYDVVNSKFCKELKQTHPQLEKYDIKEVIGDFNQHVIDVISSYRDGVLLPSYIGNMFLSAYPDKLNKFVMEMRDRNILPIYSIPTADGYHPRIVFTTSNVSAKFAHAKFYGFEASNALRAALTKAFAADWKQWIILPNIRFVKGLFKRRQYAEKMRSIENEKLKDYDEFKFE